MKVGDIFKKTCKEIGNHLEKYGFKTLKNGQVLKKLLSNKDIICEIYFQSSTHNDAHHISIIPAIQIYSKKLKPWSISWTKNPHCKGFVYGSALGCISPFKKMKEWNIAETKSSPTSQEIYEYIVKYALPIFDLFEDTETAIHFMKKNGTRFNEYTPLSLNPMDYMLFFGKKTDAEDFFNHYVFNCSYKEKIIALYNELKNEKNIDLNSSKFVDENKIKLAYVNGVTLNC